MTKPSTTNQASTEAQSVCPQCKASDEIGKYVDANGRDMRACGRCFIQWQVFEGHSVPSQSAPPDFEKFWASTRQGGIVEISEVQLENWLANSRTLNPRYGCDNRGGRWFLCSYHEGAIDAWQDAWSAGERSVNPAPAKE